MIEEHGRRHGPPHDVDQLRRGLVAGSGRWSDVRVVASTGSTNADVADAARRGSRGLVVLAEQQVSGRGRLSRSWEAPASSGLAMSMLVTPRLPMASWTWLPLLTGLAARDAVREVSSVAATLKWPNDLLVDRRKLAGILVERVDTPRGPSAVIGVGLNVTTGPDELPVPTATSLAVEGAGDVDRDALAVAVASGVDRLLRGLEQAGGDAGRGLRAAYADGCATVGSEVDVHLPNGDLLSGTATGVDASGRLEVVTSGGLRAVAAGDVVHVRGRGGSDAGLVGR